MTRMESDADDTTPPTHPQPVHLSRRPPRGRLALQRLGAAAGVRYQLLSGTGEAGRSRQARCGVLRRRSGARRQHPLCIAVSSRTDHLAVGDCGRDQPDRADRDRVDDLYGAVQSRPAVRLARPYQRGTRRLEHRDHQRAAGGAELRSAGTSAPWRAIREGEGVSRRRDQAVGQLGGRRAGHRSRLRDLRRRQQDPSDRSRRQAFPGSRTAQHRAVSPGTAGLRAGGVIRRWTRVRRALR